jgi:ribosomal protein S11
MMRQLHSRLNPVVKKIGRISDSTPLKSSEIRSFQPFIRNTGIDFGSLLK